jgi:hypothetical protein
MAVEPPALDPATRLDRTRVLASQGDGGSGDACRDGGGSKASIFQFSLIPAVMGTPGEASVCVGTFLSSPRQGTLIDPFILAIPLHGLHPVTGIHHGGRSGRQQR